VSIASSVPPLFDLGDLPWDPDCLLIEQDLRPGAGGFVVFHDGWCGDPGEYAITLIATCQGKARTKPKTFRFRLSKENCPELIE
jgi:hypothetical protein